MTKSEEVYEKAEALIASGKTKAEAFKQLAAEYGQPLGSIRGAYYQRTRSSSGESRTPRTRRRETTPDDALADARAALERAISAIDKECEAADARARESKAEADSLKATAAERKAAIAKRLEALT